VAVMPGSKINSSNLVEAFKGIASIADSHESIESYLSFAPRLPQFAAIRQLIVFHKEPLPQIIGQKAGKTTRIELIKSTPAVFYINIPDRKARTSTRGIIVILPSSQPNISRITTISYTRFWNAGVRPLARKIYPRAMPVFFTQEEIQSAFTAFEDAVGDTLRITIADITSKEERHSHSSALKKMYDTERRWTDLSIRDVFSQALERSQWFTGLRFLIHQRRGKSDAFVQAGSGRLNKYGEISFDSNYTEITTILLRVLESSASKRLKLLEKRGIRERNYKPSKPIELYYKYDAFAQVEEVRRFGKIVSKYPNATKAVFHSNPYYHASVADYLDGSSFDIWVLSSNRVVIIPQAKSSAQAFERLITHIFSNFGEGLVNEFASE
jgi:hypothetical protein